VALLLIGVGFFALLVVVWYHGEPDQQRLQRVEAVLLGVLLVSAVGGSALLVTRDQGGAIGATAGQPVVDLGDRSVAVLPFENDLEDPTMAWLDRGIAELLATDLSQVDSLRVVGVQRVIDLLRQLGESDERIVPEEHRTTVTRMAGARYMLSGRIAGQSDNVVLIASLVDTDTGEITAAARRQGSDVFALVDAVSADLLAAGLGPRAGTEMASIVDMTTRNLEAYGEYQRGKEARYLFRFPEAVEHFGRAVAIDSTFALAHFELAGVQVQVGDYAGSSESLRRARENLTHASRRDRMYIEGIGAMIGGDLAEGERRLEELIAQYPDEKDARIVLAGLKRGSRGAGPEVASLLEETLRLDPLYSLGYNQLAYNEAQRGNFDSALALIDTYVGLEPGEANPMDSRGEILTMGGRTAEAREAFRQALGLNPTFTLALRHLTESYLREGRGSEARADLAGSIESGNATVRMVARMLEAETYFWDGDFDSGLSSLSAAVDDPDPDPAQQVNALRSLQFAHLQLGRFDETPVLGARMNELTPLEGSAEMVEMVAAGEAGLIDELSSAGDRLVERFRRSPDLQVFLDIAITMSEVWKAFYRGEHDRVLELAATAPLRFGAAGTELLGYPVMRSLLALGEGDRAIGHVDIARGAGITGVPGQWDSLTLRILQYFNGRAHELAGHTEEAIASYEKLLEGWGSATRQVPLVADAEDRVAALKG